MPLLSLFASSPEAVRELTIEQVVATAGDGKLRDGTESVTELRTYLRQVSVGTLASYADHCLKNAFPKSGQVLQDIVNELGRRLEYEVTNGRYQGTTNAVGFDGIWRDPSGHGIVVEVKTTDAYRLSLDAVARYRDQLLERELLAEPSSILLVVGRADTGELEAQVRGSRHAWDVRLISVDSLLSVVRIKESADSPETAGKIRRLLTPLEYTRLDDLVDVVFTTTQDVETAVSAETGRRRRSPGGLSGKNEEKSWEFTPSAVIQDVRDRVVAALGMRLGCTFVKKSRALYWDPPGRQRLACTVSKRYLRRDPVRYWYAYHPRWHEFLQQGERGIFALGCTDLDVAFAIPTDVLAGHLEELHTTDAKDGTGEYYHIKVIEPSAGRYALQLSRSGKALPLDPFSIKIDQESRPIERKS